jgi:hypothetical protein
MGTNVVEKMMTAMGPVAGRLGWGCWQKFRQLYPSIPMTVACGRAKIHSGSPNPNHDET